jgi:hypothetical protein
LQSPSVSITHMNKERKKGPHQTEAILKPSHGHLTFQLNKKNKRTSHREIECIRILGKWIH